MMDRSPFLSVFSSFFIGVHLWTKIYVSRALPFAVSIFAAFVSGACRGAQSALDSAGVQSGRLENLWWLFLAVTAAVYVVVMAVMIAAIVRRKKGDAQTAPETAPDEKREKRLGNTIKGAVAVTTVVLFILMIVSFRTGRAIQTLAVSSPQPLQIKVTGHQWWWEIEYQDTVPSNNVTTANELHLPAGRPIKLQLQSTDVIHSFWIPNLHGKKDLIPNYPTVFYFQADKLGNYWGQCAEFCGYQHAKMRFPVTVESPEDFDKWLDAQRQTSASPATDEQKRGQAVFLTSSCVQCHTIQGTIAGGRVGPNLTHLASRSYIAAGSLPKTRAHLQDWITDPQRFKPGIRMPMNNYAPEDLAALVEYLENLK